MSLAKKAAAGFLWTTGANIGSRVVTIVSTFILTRFLVPEIQGEVNAAIVFIQTFAMLSHFGVAQYIAANPKDGRDVAFHGSVLMLAGGAVTSLICYFGRFAAADFLKAPGMAAYVPGLVLSNFIDRLGWLPRNILVRDMRFRVVGIRMAVGELTYAGSTVAFATRGWEGWSIVGGNLCRGVVALVFLVVVTNWRDYLQPCKLAWSTIAKILRFGIPVTVAGFFHLAASQWDNGFMVRRFGEAQLGLYNQAYRLADLPATNVGEQINDVLVPTFARLPDAEARRRGLLRAASLMALLVFPMAIGLGAIAKTMVAALYAPSYAGVAPFLSALATLSICRSIGVLSAGYLQVIGRTQIQALLDFILVVMVLGFMWLLSHWGPVPAAIGVGIAFTIDVLIILRNLKREGITIGSVLAAVARPLAACIPMAAAVLGVRFALSRFGLPAVVLLVIELTVGAAVYVGAAFVIAPKIARDFLDLGLGAIRRRKSKAGGASQDESPNSEADRG